MTELETSSNDFAPFRKTFFEECAEMLADMEERLGRLQSETTDNEELNAIFRAVHSIKAGAGAFNFVELVKFSHTYEALLEWLRSGRIQLNDRISNILTRAGDVLSVLVEAAQEDRRVSDGFGADVVEDLQSILDEVGKSSGAPSPAVTKPNAAVRDDQASAATEAAHDSFRIAFRPHTELFRHANEPLLLIRELKRLGKISVECNVSALPTFASLDPESAYLSWNICLVTDRPQSAILEVFEFVDEDCDLSIERVSTGRDEQEATVGAAPVPLLDTSHAATTSEAAGAILTKPQIAAGGTRAPGISSIRVDLARVDRLVNMVGELVITQAMLAQRFADQGESKGHQWVQGQEDLALNTRELQECVMAIRMQPVKSVFARMPRLVRDIAGKLNKKVRLVTSGEQTEVDKTVIEELADPLTHMIRNSVDHGIEDCALRQARGKPEEGTIELSATHRGGNILIQVADDGAGINRERLLQKALEKAIVTPGANLTEEEIDNLIFAPGFSTAEKVTDVSGRGVGMDVVRRNISNLGGRINVQSTPGQGTRFTLILPLTLAVLDGMLVAVGREKYILPLTSIVESIRPDRYHVRTLAGGAQVVSIRGEFIRLIHLSRVFNIAGAVTEPWKGLVVLVETDSSATVGIVVDELIGQQQVVIKSLQANFDPVSGISGATILGNGKVALIVDIDQLSRMANRHSASIGLQSEGASAATNGETANADLACPAIYPNPLSASFP
jgi:two-component system, chemotaxis family, sensor kinase CheA